MQKEEKLGIGYTPRVRLLGDLATECCRHEVAKSLSNQARGVQPTTTQFKNQVDKYFAQSRLKTS